MACPCRGWSSTPHTSTLSEPCRREDGSLRRKVQLSMACVLLQYIDLSDLCSLLAACIDPSIAEIVDCCNKGLNLPAEIEVLSPRPPLPVAHYGQIISLWQAGLPAVDCQCCSSVQPYQKRSQTVWLGQHKAYSRDFWIRGRARVSLYKPDGSLTNPAIPNSKPAGLLAQ